MSRGLAPALFVLLCVVPSIAPILHVIEHPVPHKEEPGDDHVGEQAGTEECSGDDEFIVHVHHLPD